MSLNPANINSLWGSLIVEELIRHGIDYFCISPGSRSTPLVAAVAGHPKAQAVVHFDERGVAFRALGYAKGSGKPAALVCTSGTAAANYFPAVVEASVNCIPLIILTADRPPELRNIGANQTIDQIELYGKYSRWFCDLPCPDTSIPPSELLRIVDRAVAKGTRSPAGPVHINCMFREPLAPSPSGGNFSSYLEEIGTWTQKGEPLQVQGIHSPAQSEGLCDSLVELIETCDSGLMVVGQLRNRTDQEAVLRLIAALRWPVFADVQSGLSLSGHHEIIRHYDLLLSSPSFIEKLRPDCILQIGDRMTSKRLLQFVESAIPKSHVLVIDHPFPSDPTHTVTDRLEGPIAATCSRLCELVRGSHPSSLMGQLKCGTQSVEGVIDESLAHAATLTECMVVKAVVSSLREDAALFLASSMPIRLVDMFADNIGRPIAVGSNRGASGIDGTVASAIGFADGLARAVTLIIGDMALLHDLNSLAMIQKARYPVTIVAINNNGGGIFEHLPIRQFPRVLEEFFVAPPNIRFSEAAAMFGIPYREIGSVGDLNELLGVRGMGTQTSLIEVMVDRAANLEFHDALLKRIGARLEQL